MVPGAVYFIKATEKRESTGPCPKIAGFSLKLTLVIGREAAELKDIRVELLDGAAQFLAH